MFNQAKDHLFEDVHVCSEGSNLFLQGWQALIEKIMLSVEVSTSSDASDNSAFSFTH